MLKILCRKNSTQFNFTIKNIIFNRRNSNNFTRTVFKKIWYLTFFKNISNFPEIKLKAYTYVCCENVIALYLELPVVLFTCGVKSLPTCVAKVFIHFSRPRVLRRALPWSTRWSQNLHAIEDRVSFRLSRNY